MASLLLDDRSGRIEATLFSEAYETYREMLNTEQVLVVTGNLNHDEFRGGLSIRIDQVLSFEQARMLHAACLRIKLDWRQLEQRALSANAFVDQLEDILAPYRDGDCELRLFYRRPDASGVLRFDQAWKVNPTDELLRRLERLFGQDAVEVVYAANARQQSARVKATLH